MKASVTPSPSSKGAVIPSSPDWKFGLCGCCGDCDSMCEATTCPFCVLSAQMAYSRGFKRKNCSAIPCVALTFVSVVGGPFSCCTVGSAVASARYNIIERYKIQESCCSTFCKSCLCSYCAGIQQTRELKARGEWYGGVCGIEDVPVPVPKVTADEQRDKLILALQTQHAELLEQMKANQSKLQPVSASSADNSNLSLDASAVQHSGGLANALPAAFCFQRGVPQGLSFRECLTALFTLRELPRDKNGKNLRPDMEEWIPTDADTDRVMNYIEAALPEMLVRPSVTFLRENYGVTDDDVRALLVYKIEEPYPVYKLMNCHLMGQRRDEKIKKSIGPMFIRIYRAMEKLPKIKSFASRAVVVRNIPALRHTFDHHQEVCAPGKVLSFWGFSSFSRDDAVGAAKFAGDTDDDAIIYSCEVTGVDMEPFAPLGMSSESEILPLCPAVFQIGASIMTMNTKLVVMLQQVNHADFAYVEPSATAPTAPKK